MGFSGQAICHTVSIILALTKVLSHSHRIKGKVDHAFLINYGIGSVLIKFSKSWKQSKFCVFLMREITICKSNHWKLFWLTTFSCTRVITSHIFLLIHKVKTWQTWLALLRPPPQPPPTALSISSLTHLPYQQTVSHSRAGKAIPRRSVMEPPGGLWLARITELPSETAAGFLLPFLSEGCQFPCSRR